MMGCCGDKKPATDRVLPSEDTKDMIMVIATEHARQLIGIATAKNYGRVNRGDVFRVDRHDYVKDRRLVLVSQETLKMFST